MQLEMLDLEVLGVERAHDPGEVGLARAQAHGNAVRRAAGVAEAGQDRGGTVVVGRVGRDRLDGRPSDLRLEGGRGALGDDVTVVDDPDPGRQRIRFFEVLRRQEDGDAVVSREPLDLGPQREPALDVEPRRRLVEKEDP